MRMSVSEWYANYYMSVSAEIEGRYVVGRCNANCSVQCQVVICLVCGGYHLLS